MGEVLWTIYLSISLGAFITMASLGSGIDFYKQFFGDQRGWAVLGMAFLAIIWPSIIVFSFIEGRWFDDDYEGNNQ